MVSAELLPQARDDYEEGYAWYLFVKKSRRAAERFTVALDNALNKVRHDPGVGAKLDDEHRFYRLKRFPYYLVYRVEPDRVVIIAVSHDRRDPDYWRGR